MPEPLKPPLRIYGTWMVIRRADDRKDSSWICVCYCGKVASVRARRLISGQSRGCQGCSRREANFPRWAVHDLRLDFQKSQHAPGRVNYSLLQVAR